MSAWFEVRNAPKPSGTVIAIWHRSNDDYELAFGAKNITYDSGDEDLKRTYARGDAQVIDNTLVHEISEADFSVLSEIADIPQIISDGQLHYLGVLQWRHEVSELIVENGIVCNGEVYTKVVWTDSKWYEHSPTIQHSPSKLPQET